MDYEDQISTLPDAMKRLPHFKRMLYASFEAQPFEDGIDHPAETIIGDALRSTDDARLFDWISRICLDPKYPVFSALVLRCLGRQVHPGTESWRTDLLRKALTMDDAEIRDAAVCAAELWGGSSIRELLQIKVQTEPLPWLQGYMEDIINDLR